jgi:hypothetical protein
MTAPPRIGPRVRRLRSELSMRGVSHGIIAGVMSKRSADGRMAWMSMDECEYEAGPRPECGFERVVANHGSRGGPGRGVWGLMAAALGVLLVALPGCGSTVFADDLDKAVVRFDRGQSARLVEAPHDGHYELRRVFDDRVLSTHDLKKGDAIGFEGRAAGDVTAVAGATRTPVETSRMHPTAFWVYRSR